MTAKDKAYRRQIYIALVVGYIMIFTIVLFICHLLGKEVVSFSSIFFGSTGAVTTFLTAMILNTPKDS